MKSQIALLGIGIVVATGVAYVELKPAPSDPITTVTSTPEPASVVSKSPISNPVATPIKSKSTISKPTISGGDDEDVEDENRRDHDDDDEEEDDD